MSEKRKLNIAMNYRIDEALFEAMSSYCSTHKITKQELVRNLLLEKLNVKDSQKKSDKAKFRALRTNDQYQKLVDIYMQLKKIGGSLVKYAEFSRLNHMEIEHQNAEQAIIELREKVEEFSGILKRLK